MNKYFVKLNHDNVVVDIISYQYEGYVAILLSEIPKNILNGCYKFENDKLTEHPELKPNPEVEMSQQIEKLEQTSDNTLLALAEQFESFNKAQNEILLAIAELYESMQK